MGSVVIASDRPTEAWKTRAACRGMDVNLFYPRRGESVVAAVAVCNRCPVRSECLAYALEPPNDEALNIFRFGIWGGKSERARRRLRKTRRAS